MVVGGRLATRRGFETKFDHGLPSWENNGFHTEQLTKTLQDESLIKPWKIAIFNSNNPDDWKYLETTSIYCVPEGMTAIAKYLTQDLTINRSFHLDQIIPHNNGWQLNFRNGETVTAKAIILAIPAPQAIPLVKDFVTEEMGDRLQTISYEPALSLMLGFNELQVNFPWQELRLNNHPIFKKIILDGQKRSPQTQTLVLQTNSTFTEQYLNADNLEPAAEILIKEIQNMLKIPAPIWHQIHRWRYAIPKQSLGDTHLSLPTKVPLILCGDWCLGQGLEKVITSGLATTTYINE